jgi:membrane protein DedA with SNARE-associated domain
MPLGRFLLYSAVGSLIWNSALIGGGAALGENWEQVKEWLKPLDTLLLIVGVPALLLLGAWRLGLLARLRRARRDRRG